MKNSLEGVIGINILLEGGLAYQYEVIVLFTYNLRCSYTRLLFIRRRINDIGKNWFNILKRLDCVVVKNIYYNIHNIAMGNYFQKKLNLQTVLNKNTCKRQ